jgi:hypothetical protein
MSLTSLEDCLRGDNPFCKISTEEIDPSRKSVTSIKVPSVEEGGPIAPRPRIDYSTERTEVYKEFINYFGDQLFVKDKSTGDYSIYMVHIKTGIMSGSRVLIAIVHEDHTVIGNMRPLSMLQWINFQTRHITKDVIHPPQVYPQKKGDIMNAQISRVRRTDNSSTYEVQGYPLVVELQKKKNSIQEWSERNKMFVALETFQCGVSFEK